MIDTPQLRATDAPFGLGGDRLLEEAVGELLGTAGEGGLVDGLERSLETVNALVPGVLRLQRVVEDAIVLRLGRARDDEFS